MSRWTTRPFADLTLWRAGQRFALLAALCLCAAAGCSRPAQKLTTDYGRRRGDAASSVNGLSVLASMFESAGHRVNSRSNAGSGIGELNVIVWAPNTFTPPTKEERRLIEAWLREKSGRTFVYIGRDFDAAPAYWSQVRNQAKPADFTTAAREAAFAESAHDTARTAMPTSEDAKWFVVHRNRPRTRVANFAGDWSTDIDAAQANIVLQGQLDLPSKNAAADHKAEAKADEDANHESDDELSDKEAAEDEPKEESEANAADAESEADDYDEDMDLYFDVLLAALPPGETSDASDDGEVVAGAPLVTRVSSAPWGDSQLIVITNGSFLLNLPLVNHQHRKLAGRLIEGCGEPGRVVIWEADSFRAVSGGDDDWSILKTWPLNFIMPHMAVLGMLYLLWRFPIFGLAHTLRPAPTSDFGKHIDALGKLTAATGDAGYAQRKLAEYRERVRRDGKDNATAISGRG